MKIKRSETQQEYYKRVDGKWEDFFCVLPRVVEGHWVWLGLVERKLDMEGSLNTCHPENGKFGHLEVGTVTYRLKQDGAKSKHS